MPQRQRPLEDLLAWTLSHLGHGVTLSVETVELIKNLGEQTEVQIPSVKLLTASFRWAGG